MNWKTLLPAILIILAVLGCRQMLKPKRADSPEMRVNVVDLAAEFKKDTDAANAKYGGRTVAVTGTVDMKVGFAPTIGFKTRREKTVLVCSAFLKKMKPDRSQYKGRKSIHISGVGRT